MLIFLDIETTGLERDDKIVSIGLVMQEQARLECHYELINEKKKISSTASSLHHITTKMIANAPSFLQSKACEMLKQYNSHANVLISHNSAFDLRMLYSAGFLWQGAVVDTLRVARHLIPECESYALQVLRYELELDALRGKEHAECIKREPNIASHHALHDALLVKLLHDSMLQESSTIAMIALSKKRVLLQKFEFGKYRGRYIEEILYTDSGYLRWMLESLPDLSEDLRYTLEYYLKGYA